MDFSESSAERGGTARRVDGQRPVSRRGFREYTNSGSALSRSATMRPTSAYRGSTAFRLSTAGFGPAPPTASRQSTAVTGFSMIDRPITQQGISGLRTSTVRGFRTRQLQDKRYWEEQMQVKVREMKAEIARLTDQADAGEREKSAKKHYEKRVRELAQELTDLQGRLADYNTAIRIANGEATKQSVEEQTRELEINNKKLQEEVELVFLEKQRKENQLRQLREQMEKEQSSISKILSEMTPEQKEQYSELEANAAALREEVEQARIQIDHLTREKEEFSKEISGSQLKMHLLELHRKLLAAEEKRDNLKDEMNNRLDPQEEREKLLLQVREDNAAIASLDSNANNLKEQIRMVQELIEQAEQDLEEGNSERHQKYRELKKREETMDTFMSTYEENLKKEQEKMEQLEKDIVFALEHSSSNIDLDLSEIDSLKQKEGYSSVYDESKKSVETLTKDYERFQANLKKAEATRERLATELQTLPEKTGVMKEELITLSDLEKLRDEGEEQKKNLESELRLLKEKLAPTESAVVEATNKLRRLQESLDGNEMYGKLNSLEEQLAQLENRKTILEEDIASITLKADYEPIKKEAMKELAALNKKIIEDLNSNKPY
ncbi:intraflagellar transport protein 74 homolog [Maniola jurtina]|uniref:intraflagellar transport protein 74 homolog n=1 Tax=Maniola jurtina TaxID=191418 RepID=UPI001E68B186|nr:intraflagellar transport protein 74 homolog [Maniola jurtina]XP_045768955.1 intraflagellar transport protein 74 homolog [Maniola jurtina]